MVARLDSVVVGFNEVPFPQYENLLRRYGERSTAYRDLKLNFVLIEGKPTRYVDLLNYASLRNNLSTPGASRFESGDIPNLASVYLCAYLRKRGISARYINLFQQERDKLAAYLMEDPVCVAITTTFYAINYPLYEMIEFIRKINRKTKIVVGGPLIANHLRGYDSSGFEEALRDIGGDIYVIDAQGEGTLARIVTCLRSGGSLSAVPNICYFSGDRLLRTLVVPENNPLDENYVDWSLFQDEDLGPTIQTRTARSCAFNCSFCNYPTRAGKLALASIQTIEKELDALAARRSIRNVVFIDDTFNVPLDRFKEICRLMIRKKYGFSWFSYFRCSNSDEEAIDLMARSGCAGVFLGIESGSPVILKNMNKAATVEKYAEGIRLLQAHDILTFASFLMGFPGETEDTVNETRRFISETSPTYYRIQPWYCEAGTPVTRERTKYQLSGNGFMWSHSTMDNSRAMDLIESIFLSVEESVWLPQWSFDFWIIPYLLGRGISLDRLKRFLQWAGKLLRTEFAIAGGRAKKSSRDEILALLLNEVGTWRSPESN